MTETKGSETPNLNLSKIGSWEDIISVSENIESLLNSAKPEDVKDEISEKEFETLAEEWEKWRPHTADDFSEEMREKTAKQSSVGESTLEKENKKARHEIKSAGKQVSKASEKAEEKDLGEAKNHLSNAVECTGRAVDKKIRQGVRAVEEKIYEKLILKANSLYFDNSSLNAVLSKRLKADPSEHYQLTLHSHNSHLREFFAEKIEWDDC